MKRCILVAGLFLTASTMAETMPIGVGVQGIYLNKI